MPLHCYLEMSLASPATQLLPRDVPGLICHLTVIKRCPWPHLRWQWCYWGQDEMTPESHPSVAETQPPLQTQTLHLLLFLLLLLSLLLLLLLLLLLKPAAQTKVGKTKLFINCLRNPTSTCATEHRKTQLREATNDWLLLSGDSLVIIRIFLSFQLLLNLIENIDMSIKKKKVDENWTCDMYWMCVHVRVCDEFLSCQKWQKMKFMTFQAQPAWVWVISSIFCM